MATMLDELKRWRFLLALLGTTMPVAGYVIGQNYQAFVVAFVIFPVLDWLLGKDPSNPAAGEMKRLGEDPVFRGILYAYVPIHLGLIVWCAWVIARGELSAAQGVGLALSVGIVTGAQGITIAHELGHARSKLDRWLARVLLTSVSYGHFIIEHNRGHHVRVATREDPATARYGESFWRFLPRTVVGSYVSAWRIEIERLARLQMQPVHWRNQMIWFTVLPFAIAGALALALGAYAALAFALQSAMAVTLLEAVNYVEHYGLVRLRRADGSYERVAHRHSWDADNFLSNCFLVHLQRHADHHTHPARPYQLLLHHDDSPKLPTGYGGMVPLALVPPLWFALMNRRVPAQPA
jgi:alkane 1-monooxygenase